MSVCLLCLMSGVSAVSDAYVSVVSDVWCVCSDGAAGVCLMSVSAVSDVWCLSDGAAGV